MKNLFAYDFTNRTITASKTTLKKAGNPSTPEYKALIKMIEGQPTFRVVVKDITTKENKRTYHGLTMAVMKAHLEMEDQENKTSLLAEFEDYKAQVKKMEQSVYPLCKQWFLEKYPHFKVSEGQKTARKINLAHIKANAKNGKVITLENKPAVNQ